MSARGTVLTPERYNQPPLNPGSSPIVQDYNIRNRSGPQVRLSPKNIERSQRLDAFLQDKDNYAIICSDRAIEHEGIPSANEREKELDGFMESVTDKAVVEDAKVATVQKN
jgi:hypothetical protein